jgi:Zn-dependent peptidase ImmA (M78 family)
MHELHRVSGMNCSRKLITAKVMPMSEDYRVTKRSDKQVREIAHRTKLDYKADNRWPVNIIDHLQSGRILTIQGQRKLVYRIVDDREMVDSDGRTDFSPEAVVISVKRSVHEKANWGDGRSRMTLVHELGHGVMHPGAAKFRRSDAVGTTSISRINASESAEHQAKVFASAFLIDDAFAATLANADEISEQFGVSSTAAEICFERLAREAEHAKASARVLKMSEDFQDVVGTKTRQPDTPSAKYADATCTSCGMATLIPVGTKYLCDTCNVVSDQFQDGDNSTGI